MKRLLVIVVIFLLIITEATSATYDWYKIQWDANNDWLNNSSQQLAWTGFTGKDTATFGVQYAQVDTPPPPGMTFTRDLTLVVSSEPQLTKYRLTKIGDPTKYWRTYLTLTKVSGLIIDKTAPAKYIPIYLNGWNYWGGNFLLNTRSNAEIFSNDSGFNGIYTTYFRFRLYPTAHLLDEDYLLLDETMHYNLKYWGSGQEWTATALVAVPYVTEVDVLELQRTAGTLTVGSVEFLSDDAKNNHTYKLQISPGEAGSTGFAFHRIGGTASTIPYNVRIGNSGASSSSFIERTVTTKDANNHWHDFIELQILGFNQSATFSSGDYQSRIKISLISNY